MPRQAVASRSKRNVVVLSNDPQAAVQDLVARVSEQLETIAQRVVERYRDEIVDYRLADPEVLADVYGVSLNALQVTVSNLAIGRRPTLDELEGTRAGAGRRVHQDVSLESFLHALRLWGQALWETVLSCARTEIPAERDAALSIAGQLLEHLDLQSIAATQGYLQELQSTWSDREVVRRDLLDALLAGDGESERVRRLAKSLGLRLCDSYVVLILRSEERPVEENPERSLPARIALRRTIETARARLKPADGGLLIGMRHGEVVAFYPCEQAADLETIRQSCIELANDLSPQGASIGVSGCHHGLAQLSLGYAQSREAVDIAVKSGRSGRVVMFDDVLIDSIVRSSRHAEQTVQSTVAPLLEYDSARQAELVSTLRAYIESGFNVTKSAEALCVHPNTVVYRLGRIRELTGRDPHAPDDLMLLYLGLKLIELGPSD